MLVKNPNWRANVRPTSDVAIMAAEYVNWGRGNAILPFQVEFLNNAFQRKKDGTWKYYDKSGNILATETYNDGILQY